MRRSKDKSINIYIYTGYRKSTGWSYISRNIYLTVNKKHVFYIFKKQFNDIKLNAKLLSQWEYTFFIVDTYSP